MSYENEYELVHEQRKGEILYRLYTTPDDTPVRGNALYSGDEATDRKCEDEILHRLDAGDTWAWASVKVEASIADSDVDITGTSYLGCCSYRNTRGFLRGGYWPYMMREALASLKNHLQTAADAWNRLERKGKGERV